MSAAEHVAGQCHCGAVRFEAQLIGGIGAAFRCNCSYCRMRGAVIVFSGTHQLKILSGAESLTRYAFHTRSAVHYFCKICGIYTHHQRRFDPSQFAINVACIDGMSPFDFEDVPVMDGMHHPRDSGGGELRVVGHLRFEKTQ